jgi:ParB family chromosome partitioning protein
MSKLDKILATSGSNIDASMGAGRSAKPLHGATPTASASGPARLEGLARSKNAAEIPVDRIERAPEQPREDFNEEGLERLAQSLKTRGQLQPIRVRWDEGRRVYVIVCGERRWRAAKMAGLSTLSCVIMDRPAEPGELLALQLVENALREDLRPIEQARAYKALLELHTWSARQLAAELAINPATVTRALALLELPTSVQDRVEEGSLAPATAYEVSKVEDPAIQAEVAQVAVDEGLKRSEVAELVQAVKARRPVLAARPEPVAFDLGDCTVTVRWKKASPTTAPQALKKALKMAQHLERPDQAA